MADVAVVVGASGALGGHIVRRLVSKGLVAVGVARDGGALAPLADELGDAFVPCPADIGDDTAIAAIAATLAQLDAQGAGTAADSGDGDPTEPDIADRPTPATVAMVVHAAGLPVAGGVLDAPPSALVQAANIKVAGMMRLVRAVDSRLRRHSRLVAIGGHYGFEPSAYAATAGVGNAGLANLIRQYSWAYGSRGVTAHLLAPGPVDTPRVARIVTARAAQSGRTEEEELAAWQGESALGQFTSPESVAWAVAMLLDEEADALAGSSLMLDAGRRKGLP